MTLEIGQARLGLLPVGIQRFIRLIHLRLSRLDESGIGLDRLLKLGDLFHDAMAKSGTNDEKVASRGAYQKNITAIIDQATAAGVKPVMLTATVIYENLASKENGLLAPYNDFLRQLAKQKKVPMADLYAMFEERIKAENKPNEKVLTSGGVHMNTEGNKLMAIGVLKAFGLNETEIAKAKAAWVPLEAAAVEFGKQQAIARAKAAAEKAAAAAKAKANAKK